MKKKVIKISLFAIFITKLSKNFWEANPPKLSYQICHKGYFDNSISRT